ncbi:MAG: M81 family metallopeptidase [Chloroflexota bacterium]|jgi:microcystin degradation protein MlrC|nr:M81 family metallopeptidase [Chloroflexota bacterium]MDP6509006.1 M81 family metallopeptidase [Chloroflexota bacterium]MDP6756847.1 M81 family metallopeptidase [Chloroflexota bacterium]
MRIAYGGISCENTTFNPVLTRLADFQIIRGDELPPNVRYGFLADHSDVDLVPLLFARSGPGGPIDAGDYNTMQNEFLDRLCAAGSIDGLYLDLHGAMYAAGRPDPEGDLIRECRAVVGPDIPIAISLDLHGNVSDTMTDNVQIATAYRTAPHDDMVETRARAVALLVRTITEDLKPVVYRLGIPVLFPGELTSTIHEPMKSVYAMLPDVDRQAGVLNASLMVGFAWTDSPIAMANAIVVGFDAAACRAQCARIAAAYWEAREACNYGVRDGSFAQCLDWAREHDGRPVFISDSGDNPTAGGVADLNSAVAELIEREETEALYASIADNAAIERIRAAGQGAEVSIALGGKFAPAFGEPLAVTGRVQLFREDPGAPFDTGALALLRIGGVDIIVTAHRCSFTDLAEFDLLDIDPTKYRVVAVKLGYLFSELREIASLGLMALTPGTVTLDLDTLGFNEAKRPMYPLDRNFAWSPPAPGEPGRY